MNHTEGKYFEVGYQYERKLQAIAVAHTIRRMLESEKPEDQAEARRLIEQGREEARRS